VNKDPQLQEFLKYIQDMTVNYASILALNPDMFPQIKPDNPNLEGLDLSAFRF
jgi:hypothetical protein